MKMFKRKSPIQRVGDSIKHALDPSSGPSLGRSGMGSVGKTLKDARPANDKAMKAGGLAAAALTALTAASAGISSLRRRQEGAKDDS